jgi:glutamine synthetase adenylyltransferase
LLVFLSIYNTQKRFFNHHGGTVSTIKASKAPIQRCLLDVLTPNFRLYAHYEERSDVAIQRFSVFSRKKLDKTSYLQYNNKNIKRI